jgi:hypothetical protein
MKILLKIELNPCCKKLVQEVEKGKAWLEYHIFNKQITLLVAYKYKDPKTTLYYDKCPYCRKELEVK